MTDDKNRPFHRPILPNRLQDNQHSTELCTDCWHLQFRLYDFWDRLDYVTHRDR